MSDETYNTTSFGDKWKQTIADRKEKAAMESNDPAQILPILLAKIVSLQTEVNKLLEAKLKAKYPLEAVGSAKSGFALTLNENGLTQNNNNNNSGLPTGANGDILINVSGTWVPLVNPGTPTGGDWDLRHDGTEPYWNSVNECTT